MVQKPMLNNEQKGTGQREVRLVWNNAMRANHQNFSNSRRNFAPTIVLTKSSLVPLSTAKQSSSKVAVPVSTARPIRTAALKSFVNVAKPRPNAFQKSHLPSRRPFYHQTSLKNRNLYNKVNTTNENSVNTANGKRVISVVGKQRNNAVKSSACWIWRPTGKVIDHGDPQVALKDTGLFDMTSNKSYLTDYQDYDGRFVVFARSSKRGKITGKGKIRTGKLDFEDVYFVKELKFNLFSVSQMCDRKNNVLFTKSECLILSPEFKLPDESQVMLKIPRKDNMYSFDLKNVVPTKGLTCLFAKAINDESKMWHRRLGHINFKNINKLVKGNLVRGLPSKIFQNDHSCVACQKGKQHKATWIKREFNNARTPQQKGVAKRKNRTLIEAARTMLADSLLPITFWAEAVNIACYVQNRVLVTKPHNKTPYELLIGRTPIISFMRPFGCPVTILNTLDHLGKFDGKADEGFLVGYSINSKAFRVFNSFETTSDAGQARKEQVPDQEYILLPLMPTNSYVSSSSKEAEPHNDASKNALEQPACVEEDPTDDLGSLNQQVKDGDDAEINNIHDLEDTGIFDDAYNDRDEGAEVDYNNLESQILVSPIPSTKVHKDHPKDQIIGEVHSVIQTRSMINQSEAGLITFINKHRRSNHKDFQNCLFACFLSQMEPKKISQALEDESWVEAMQEELLQFQLQKVWILVDLPLGKKAIAQGHIQEEGVDYDEVFAPVARIEAIRLFLAFASYMGFPVYQMDIKSSFLYGTIGEEVYVHQPPGFVDHAYPNKVYKVVKALYGLHQAPRAGMRHFTFLLENGYRRGTINKTLFINRSKSDIIFQMSSMGELTFFLGIQVKQQPDGIFIYQDKYVADILKKFDFCSIKSATTPIESNKTLVKDEDGVDVDVHVYRSMTGSLMYLIASRLDIIFAVCACARFQVTPKASHLHAVKRIFRYLKHQPKLGLWYPRDSPF
ncbi:putative ribonuclease H-like domain-containing protein [Tanacetum coccineum]